MQKACSLMEQGHVVSHIAGPNGERIDIVDIRNWCAAHASRQKRCMLSDSPFPAAVDARRAVHRPRQGSRGRFLWVMRPLQAQRFCRL